MSETSYLNLFTNRCQEKLNKQIKAKGSLPSLEESFPSRNFNESALAWTIIAPHIQNLAAESREVMLQDACHTHCA